MDEREKTGTGRRRLGMLGALVALTAAFVLVFPMLQQHKLPMVAGKATVKTDTTAGRAADSTATGVDPIERFRAERERTRTVEIAQLNALIDDKGADQAIRDEARRALIDLTTFMEQEVTIEGVLAARGFEGALATVHRESVNVLVRGEAITRAQSAIILELALRETGQQSGNIKIIPVA